MKTINKIIEINYHLKVVDSVKINKGLINELIILDTYSEKYILKKLSTKNLSDINYEIAIIDYLISKKFLTPNIIPANNKEKYVIYNNYYYFLFEYTEEVPKLINYENYAKLLSDFFMQMKGYDLIERQNWYPLYKCKWLKNSKNISLKPELIKILNLYETKLYKLYHHLPKIVVHGDFKTENIINSNEGLCLIDFGNSRPEARAFDIIHLADSVTNKRDISIEGILEFINSISKYVKMSDAEKKSFIYLLIIHKINEYFFYNKIDKEKKEKILKEIVILVDKEEEFSKKVLKIS